MQESSKDNFSLPWMSFALLSHGSESIKAHRTKHNETSTYSKLSSLYQQSGSESIQPTQSHDATHILSNLRFPHYFGPCIQFPAVSIKVLKMELARTDCVVSADTYFGWQMELTTKWRAPSTQHKYRYFLSQKGWAWKGRGVWVFGMTWERVAKLDMKTQPDASELLLVQPQTTTVRGSGDDDSA